MKNTVKPLFLARIMGTMFCAVGVLFVFNFANAEPMTGTIGCVYDDLQSVDSTVFSANYSPEAYKIEYVLNGGNNEPDACKGYNIESETIALPANPTREKYIFMGWHEDPDFNDDVIAQIDTGTTGDKVFYAEWKKAPFVCESGKWLNVMGEKICMSETKPEGQPSLVVQMPQQQGKHYIMLINNSNTPIHEGSNKKLRIKIGDKTYNAYDASVDIE